MNRYFDPLRNCLFYLGEKADASFWEKSWTTKDLRKDLLSRRLDTLVVPTTRCHLKPGARILEGGCGKGEYVYLLSKAGYQCFGIDIAKKTVAKIRQAFPGLHVSCGDVRKLGFPDNYFDGYWSLGVIEHFFEGYEQVIREMARVIAPGGYLFITFPQMSAIRRLKTRLGLYPEKHFTQEPSGFYQFVLDSGLVISKIERHCFRLVSKQPLDGFKGFKDEIRILSFIFDPLNDLSKKNSFFGGIRLILSKLMAPFAGHTILLIFQKPQ